MVVPLAFGWRDLLFANWRVDPDALAARLPDALAVETYDGDGWLSVVPFRNVDVRPRGLPAAAGVDLPELNLRTYVTRDGEPGIYFLSLDADMLSAVLGARLTHRLPYYYARVRLDHVRGGDRGGGVDGAGGGDGTGGVEDGQGGADSVRFTSRRRHPGARPARFAATYRPVGEPFGAAPGSTAEFLTERRRLYTVAQDGSVRYTDVSHPRWPLYAAELTVEENTLFEANGFDHPGGEPTLYYSPGVDVVTSRSRRWGSRERPTSGSRRPSPAD